MESWKAQEIKFFSSFYINKGETKEDGKDKWEESRMCMCM